MGGKIKMIRPGLEPGTFCVLDRCDNQLRHRTASHCSRWNLLQVQPPATLNLSLSRDLKDFNFTLLSRLPVVPVELSGDLSTSRPVYDCARYEVSLRDPPLFPNPANNTLPNIFSVLSCSSRIRQAVSLM